MESLQLISSDGKRILADALIKGLLIRQVLVS